MSSRLQAVEYVNGKALAALFCHWYYLENRFATISNFLTFGGLGCGKKPICQIVRLLLRSESVVLLLAQCSQRSKIDDKTYICNWRCR